MYLFSKFLKVRERGLESGFLQDVLLACLALSQLSLKLRGQDPQVLDVPWVTAHRDMARNL